MRQIEEQDGNKAGASRFGTFASRITLGGTVIDADAVNFETCVRFRYRVVHLWPHYVIELHDRRSGRRQYVPGAWFWRRRKAQMVCAILNDASDLALEEGWM